MEIPNGIPDAAKWRKTAETASIRFMFRFQVLQEQRIGQSRGPMDFFRSLWTEEDGQDIAEYAVMLAVILVIVVGTVRLIGTNANNVFSNVASAIQ